MVNTTGSQPDQSVRLFNQVSEGNRVTGIVEIVYDGRWGLLCDPTFLTESEVAESVCEGFGFSRSSRLFTVDE